MKTGNYFESADLMEHILWFRINGRCYKRSRWKILQNELNDGVGINGRGGGGGVGCGAFVYFDSNGLN